MVCIIWDRTEREDVGRVWTSEKQAQEPSYERHEQSQLHCAVIFTVSTCASPSKILAMVAFSMRAEHWKAGTNRPHNRPIPLISCTFPELVGPSTTLPTCADIACVCEGCMVCVGYSVRGEGEGEGEEAGKKEKERKEKEEGGEREEREEGREIH